MLIEESRQYYEMAGERERIRLDQIKEYKTNSETKKSQITVEHNRKGDGEGYFIPAMHQVGNVAALPGIVGVFDLSNWYFVILNRHQLHCQMFIQGMDSPLEMSLPLIWTIQKL